jgi:hypothetical protein
MRAMLKIHEMTTATGALAAVYLRVRVADGDLELVAEDGAFVVPHYAFRRVMERYGAALEDGAQLDEVAGLDLADGTRLRHVRHLARFDVIAKDWLVYEPRGAEPICALANTVAGALGHLARAAAATTPDSGS